MTERTYTQSEMETIRDAAVAVALREAAEIVGDSAIPEVNMYYDAILALIDQPSTLDTLIGAAYLDMHNMLDADAPYSPAIPDAWTHEEIVPYEAGKNDAVLSWQYALRKRTPAYALAALEQVKLTAFKEGMAKGIVEQSQIMERQLEAMKQAERERWVPLLEDALDELKSWLEAEDSLDSSGFIMGETPFLVPRIAAAIRGESK